MMGIIYKATVKPTGKSYIGQTVRPLHKRIIGHYSHKRVSDSYFSNALNKYTRDEIEWSVLCVVPKGCYADLDKAEQRWIQDENTMYPNGYNLTEGGYSGRKSFALILKMNSPSVKQKISTASKRCGKILNIEI